MNQGSIVEAGPAIPRRALRRRPSSPAVILMSVDAVGGVWRYAMELARALPRQSYRVVFAGLGPKPRQEQVKEAKALGDLVWLDQPLDWMTDSPEDLAAVGPALSALSHECGADLLHLNLPSQAAGLNSHLPVVTVAHSCLPTWWKAVKGTTLPARWRWHLQINQAGFDASNAIVVPSGSHAQNVSDCYRCLDRLQVVHNGIASFLPRARGEPMLFAAGRWWDEGKNGAILSGAAPRLDWPMVAAGPLTSPEGQTLDLPGVRTLGPLAHEQVLDHMRRADILVSPSIYEPFGLAPLEGARAGAALMLANIATYRELWEGSAIFFDPTDPGDLAAKASMLIQDAEMRAAGASAALSRSRSFTPDRQAAAMDAIYRSHLPQPVPYALEVS
ncbi:MAG: glycosyltransferase family 4 protein [Aquamicrobium sp.]|jgi:glycosyltransferase involved in cell wall biosynthesis|nr:glycosyltransferase family 4 protein [Aquamicrobium sp.]